MKRRIMKKKAKRVCKALSDNDGTCHNILVYFYKKIVNNGFTFYVYTARPKVSGGSGTPYRYILWLKSLNFSNGE